MSILTMEAQCLDERGSFFKLIDTIASEIGELKQEMVQTDLELEDGPASIQSLEKDMSDLCPDQKNFKSFPRDSGYDSLPNKLSILDKLLHTHPVWLQLGLSDTEAAEVLQTQPPGTFLVRKSTRMQKKVLSLRLPTPEFGSCLKEFAIKESTYTFSLEGSGISFADLFRLIAFYCISRDVLPFTLKLPRAVAAATTEAELEEVAQQGLGFWSSPANNRLHSLPPLQQPLPPDCISKDSQQLCLINGVHSIRTRTPSELECSQTNGALCFINPLFLKVHSQDIGGNLKRPCLRTQDGNGLERARSPPPRPPPPSIHSLLTSPQLSRTVNQASSPESTAHNKHCDLDLLQKKPTPIPPPRLKKKALSLEAESSSEGAQPNRPSVQGPETVSIPGGALPPQTSAGSRKGLVVCSESPAQCNGGRQRLSDMSLSTSSSDSLEFDRSMPLFAYDGDTNSSLEEYEGESDQESMAPPLKPKKKRSSSFVLPKIVKSQLRKVSGVFSSFMTPEKRMIKKIAELSRDKRTYFGSLVQDYVSFLQENKECHVSSTDLLQTIRQFMTQVKSYLSQSSELDPPIESLIPEDQIDVVLEKAMHKSILKPLKGHIEAMLREFHMADGSWKQLKENLQLVRQRNPQELGVFVPTPDFVDVEKIKVKFMTMQKMYSPEKKVMLLLRVCKLIYTVMENNSGRMYGADDFLPVLTYVVAQCDMLELDAEIEYMMELLDPSLLHGEGGYYLTSAYGALSLIKNFQEEQAARLLCSEARNTLRQWHKRRTTNRTIPSVDDFQNYLRVAFQEVSSGCTGKTLLVRPYITTEDVCRLCAEKFKVDNADSYSLFLFIDDTWQQLTEDTYPQKIKAELHSRPQPQVFHFVYKRINSDPYGAVFQNDNSNHVL
ncbi:ras and Rab interactor 2 isoform X1 [Paroedura picta]|uniref:ras and Rab interactor 2 isoform X1 n=1 Tax=Paroedura picta TaxID=143630 RepID=UPI004056FCFC